MKRAAIWILCTILLASSFVSNASEVVLENELQLEGSGNTFKNSVEIEAAEDSTVSADVFLTVSNGDSDSGSNDAPLSTEESSKEYESGEVGNATLESSDNNICDTASGGDSTESNKDDTLFNENPTVLDGDAEGLDYNLAAYGISLLSEAEVESTFEVSYPASVELPSVVEFVTTGCLQSNEVLVISVESVTMNSNSNLQMQLPCEVENGTITAGQLGNYDHECVTIVTVDSSPLTPGKWVGKLVFSVFLETVGQ